jgi:hypothetical protein
VIGIKANFHLAPANKTLPLESIWQRPIKKAANAAFYHQLIPISTKM